MPAYQCAMRRHRPGDVLGEQGDERVGVAALQRRGVAVDDLAQAGVVDLAQRALLARRRHLLGDELAGPLQRAVHRRRRGVHHRGDLGGGEAEHLEEQERRPLVARQVLQGRDERQLHRLALLGARRRARRGTGPSQATSVTGTSPAVTRVARGPEVDGQRAAAAGVDEVEARAGGHRVQPGAQRAPALERAELAPGAHQRVLQCVVGVVRRAEHPVAVRVQLAAQRRHQAAEGVVVAGAGPGEVVRRDRD